ncbi:MAG: chromosome segregation protein SMC [Pseudomonadota bacterium]
MRIKKLELLGFKSFMSKTVIGFDTGITGVVGPNGCGKSNIVDALLWVMGEQSPKMLRGGSMDDVIFKGSDIRKPSSLAEVSVTLENDGVFPVGYLNFSEISITRRLYKDGESEYLINKVPVRLKDVKEVFMDSGARTYAVIEQGEIERVILAKPEDRREIIEEAAGITKYRTRKEESQRKLETTEQNLLRLNDIILELEKQLGDVERQAKKAQGYKKLSGELKELELKLGSRDYARLNSESLTLREEINKYETEKQDLVGTISKCELDLETRKSQKLTVEEELNDLQNRTVELNTSINTSQAKLEMIEAEKGNIANNAEIRKHEIESLNIRIERGESEISGIDTQAQSQEEVLKKAEGEVSNAESKLNSKIEEYEALQSGMEEKKSKLLEHVQKEITAQNNITNFTERLESNSVKLQRYTNDRSKYEAELSAAKETLSLLEDKFTDGQRKRTELDKELSELKTKRDVLEKSSVEKDKQRDEAKLRLNTVNSRFDLLSDLSKKLEGVSSGVKYIVNSEKWKTNVTGLLADIIETAPEYEKAVAAVIGGNIDALIVDDSDSILGIINNLKKEKQGQACFIPSKLKDSVEENPFTNSGSMLGWLTGNKKPVEFWSVLNFDKKYEPVIKSLFSKVYLVQDVGSALSLWAEAKTTDFVLVTMDGDVIDGRGVIRGGSPEAVGKGLLERKREIKDLEVEKNYLVKKLSGLEIECADINEYSVETASKIDKINLDLSSIAVDVASLSKELDSVRNDFKRQEQRLSETNFEIDQLNFENSHLNKEIESARTLLGSSGDSKLNIENELKGEKSKLDVLAADVEMMRKNVTDLKVYASQVAERFKTVDERRRFLREAIDSDKSRLTALCDENQRASTRVSDLDGEFAGTKDQGHQDMQRLDSVNKEINEIRQRYSDINDAVTGFEKMIRDTRHTLDSRADAVNAVNASLAEISINQGVLKQRFMDKYETDIISVYETYMKEEINEDETREDITSLNRKLGDMGQVNLLAIDEFDKLNERYTFLSAQKQDLVTSMEDLRTAIRKIDDTSKTRFKTTFELVNEKFKKFFPILFGGGTAELVMTDPEDLLTTGVDVVAQLPGKKTENINLFSGGEKALTAISLVFSIFAIKPSPFCILDEVDAPLDDANITRFNEAVKALMDKSQFIVITHNKKTMENFDVLYGITMEDPGISRIVSVKMGDLEKTTSVAKPTGELFPNSSQDTVSLNTTT